MDWSTCYKNGLLEQGFLVYIMHNIYLPFVPRKRNCENCSINDFERLELNEDFFGF